MEKLFAISRTIRMALPAPAAMVDQAKEAKPTGTPRTMDGAHESMLLGYGIASVQVVDMLQEVHPGEILLEDFMKPLGISAARLAADIGLSAQSVRRLIRGKRRLTPETALRLGLFFRMEPRFWANLQIDYELRIATRASLKRLQQRVNVPARRS